MEDLLQHTLDRAAATAAAAAAAADAAAAAAAAADGGFGPATSANGMVFLLVACLGVVMALVYVPIRLFLTITARSRRLRLLQRIRRLRDDLGQPLGQSPSGS